MQQPVIRLVITAVLVTILTACGQKGDLYLPDRDPQEAQQPRR